MYEVDDLPPVNDNPPHGQPQTPNHLLPHLPTTDLLDHPKQTRLSRNWTNVRNTAGIPCQWRGECSAFTLRDWNKEYGNRWGIDGKGARRSAVGTPVAFGETSETSARLGPPARPSQDGGGLDVSHLRARCRRAVACGPRGRTAGVEGTTTASASEGQSPTTVKPATYELSMHNISYLQSEPFRLQHALDWALAKEFERERSGVSSAKPHRVKGAKIMDVRTRLDDRTTSRRPTKSRKSNGGQAGGTRGARG